MNVIISQLKDALIGYEKVKFAMAFGSILKEKYFHSESDIDIGIAGELLFTPEYTADLNIDLSTKFNRKIDLIDLNKVTGIILQQILCNGYILINKHSEIYFKLIKKMWYNQADMMPNFRYILKYRRDKMLLGDSRI